MGKSKKSLEDLKKVKKLEKKDMGKVKGGKKSKWNRNNGCGSIVPQ